MAETVLVLTSRDMEGLVTMDECVEVVEEAFRELGHQIAQVIPRRRIHLPLPEGESEADVGSRPRRWYWLNVIPGAVPKYDTAAVRLDSAQVRFRTVGGQSRMEFPGDFTGLVLLFSIKELALKGIIHDHYVCPSASGPRAVSPRSIWRAPMQPSSASSARVSRPARRSRRCAPSARSGR